MIIQPPLLCLLLLGAGNVARRITDAWLSRWRSLLEDHLSSTRAKCKLTPADLYGLVVALQQARLEAHDLRLALLRCREAERADTARRPTPARPLRRVMRPFEEILDDEP